jgi:hypothetical protein
MIKQARGGSGSTPLKTEADTINNQKKKSGIDPQEALS